MEEKKITQEKIEEKKEVVKTKKTKKSKKRNLIVILFLLAIIATLYIMFRGAYLEKLEIGQQYISTFWKNFQYKAISIVVTFVFLFSALYITNRRIYSGLKDFYNDEKRICPNYLINQYH